MKQEVRSQMLLVSPVAMITLLVCLSVFPLSAGAAFLPSDASSTGPWTSFASQSVELASSSSASDLLYEDQRAAMARRSAVEESLMSGNAQELVPPKLKAPKPDAGKGFASGGGSSAKSLSPAQKQLAVQQAKVLKKDGVIRIPKAMDPEVADGLRAFVLKQELLADEATSADPALSRSLFGVENARKNRCDLQLSLLRDANNSHVVADALQDLLGARGSLRPLYEKVSTLEGEFYELAAVITHKGSDRQQVHPDLPFRPKPPLFVTFCALQDITVEMGPTSFLLGTHTKEERLIFEGDEAARNDQLAGAAVRLATLEKGDAVVFDARILHCGNANEASSRALFNFSFLSPGLSGSLPGYPGSIRPGYCSRMTLSDLAERLVDYGEGNEEPFLQYGDGL